MAYFTFEPVDQHYIEEETQKRLQELHKRIDNERRQNMGPLERRDLLDATIYAVAKDGQYQKLGKLYTIRTDFSNGEVTKTHLEIMQPVNQQDTYNTYMTLAQSKNILNGTQMYDRLCKSLRDAHEAQKYTPIKIIQNGPAYIVFWKDGTKTMIKKKEDDLDDPYAAFGQALMIKIFGTTSGAHKMVDKHLTIQKTKDKKVMDDTEVKEDETDGRNESV